MSLSYLFTDPAKGSLCCDPNSSHFISSRAWFLFETSQIFTRAGPLRRNSSQLNPQTEFFFPQGLCQFGCLTGSLAHHASAFLLVAMVWNEMFTGNTRKEKLKIKLRGWPYGVHLLYQAVCLEILDILVLAFFMLERTTLCRSSLLTTHPLCFKGFGKFENQTLYWQVFQKTNLAFNLMAYLFNVSYWLSFWHTVNKKHQYIFICFAIGFSGLWFFLSRPQSAFPGPERSLVKNISNQVSHCDLTTVFRKWPRCINPDA